MVEGKQFKTKLCVSYQRGRCFRHNCSFAHGTADLRPLNGKADYRGGDLRNKISQRLSTRERYSPRRDASRNQKIRGSSPSRSLENNGDPKRRKKHHIDGQSGFSGSVRISDGVKDLDIEKESTSSGSRFVIKEKLKEVQIDIDVLDSQRSELRILEEQNVEEVGTLTSRIAELEAQLSKEMEESKRITYQIKKFVKAHRRFIRAQDELKRSQIRLNKLGDQLGSDAILTNDKEEDSCVNIVSDGETAAYRAANQLDELQNNSSASKRTSRGRFDTAETSTPANITSGGEHHAKSSRWGKSSQLHMLPAHSKDNEEVAEAGNRTIYHQRIENESMQQRGKSGSATSSAAERLKGSGISVPSTSMAAHAMDELVDIEGENNDNNDLPDTYSRNRTAAAANKIRKLPILPPPPLPVSNNNYSQYETDNTDVDVEGAEDEMVNVDIV